ncbi:tol-pal system YbgF family protein [Lewinella sp. LCG006]|uniref:tetratricopeptide repeat protein n=1 Tax=Lewinella sp. LCG006 TaxID=3231911 RepID=UPI0034610DED
MRFSFLLIALNCLLLAPSQAAGYFDFNTNAQRIYDKIFELRLNEAQSLIARLKLDEPNNLIAYHLENYVDFFTIYVSEDEQAYQRIKANRDRRLNKIAEGDQNSPYYLYTQAEIRLHWALLKLRFEEYLGAFSDINRAHKLLLENQTKFPTFLGNQKDLGILHAAVGTVPDNYRWALEMLSSLEGTVEQGKREVEGVLNAARRTHFPFRQETQVLYAFLLLHLDGRPEAAWAALADADLRAEDTPLHAFVLANVAMRTGRNDEAIHWMEKAPRGEAFYPFPYLDYMLGVAKLRRLNTDGRRHLRDFLRTTRGRHYIKEAYQKLAWAELLNNRPEGYKSYMTLLQSRGANAAGGDKNAEKEAQAGIVPPLVLLKARLLYDGGYYQRALDVLASQAESSLPSFLAKLEYTYRKGRILHGLKKYEEALAQYNRTIEQGQNSEAFFACNAALQAGLIEETRGRKTSARAYFNRCLSLKPDDYSTGLHQQAKAGLSRVGQ